MHIRKIGMIGRTYRYIQRYRQILAVLFKYGFGDLVDTLQIEQYLEVGLQLISRKRREKLEIFTRAQRVRMALEELGPTFIKMGQILSSRPDLLPVEFIRELEKLQDHVPSFEYSQVEKIIETELGIPLRDAFRDFNETPLASASIGQVHKARLIEGDNVVVKIQRPEIKKTVEVDLEIILHLATLMEKHIKGAEIHQPTKIVQEFAQTLEKELDYNIEANHMERFAMQFLKDSSVYVPKTYREFSTSRILTMEYIDGIKSSETGLLEKANLDRHKIACRGFDLIMEQIFVHGFFHADPHPGNIFIMPNNIICYLDFGMMGRIGRESREHFTDLIMSAVRRDEAKATEALLRFAIADETPDQNALERDLANFIDQHLYGPLKKLDLGKLLFQLLEIIARYRLKIQPDIFLMIKALSTAEGLGRILDPEFDAVKQATPFIRRVQSERLHPKRLATDIYDSARNLLYLIKDIPEELREILMQARKGKIKMEFQHRGLEPVLSTLDRASNRLAFAIVLASLVIGSSLIVLSDIPPKWNDIPIIGIVGFLIAGIMGFWLLVTTLKRGKM